ncbi:hypothetical protein [Actomonas aquatica]|uniref:Uncharacterized protein n=1 Tax=Actomonas aquatica TaxID=2866162 RepID=A0ABZ1CFM6_9BACT|nr:hypothetical protein [Opitutus sp. WL0086]WRQ90023.1 hypothetical protein K1X11_011445 [Opitutus sp. WL0086]
MSILCWGGLLVAVPSGQAVEVRPPPFEELVNAADYVVRAKVTDGESVWEGGDGQRQIFTYFTLEVEEVLSGAPPEPLVLRTLGGRVGGKRVRIEGMPELQIGGEYILFVRGNERQFFPLVAMMHGMYPIVRHGDQGEAMVARANGELLRSTKDVAKPMGHVTGEREDLAAALPPLTLQQFQEQIRSNAKKGTP